jgi:allophanate hydrolase
MKPALKIVSPGPHTTVQGKPRIGYQAIGVPPSGPLDRVSLRLANALVGNSAEAPALELLLLGPVIEVAAESVRVALVGCAAQIEVRSQPPRAIPAGRSVRLTRGEVFRIGPLVDSACAYLAVEGGFAIEPVLASPSTYVRGGLGGLHGRRLEKGDEVTLALTAVDARAERELAEAFDPGFERGIRVVLGPQDDYFTAKGVRTFLSAEYTVSPAADRMGFRLDGPPIQHANDYNIVSDGIVSGSVQVPGTGRPIVLMVDNQTTGGYPKIATVISADVPLVGRRRPGRALRFTAVDVPAAEQARRTQEAEIEAHISRMRSIAREDCR